MKRFISALICCVMLFSFTGVFADESGAPDYESNGAAWAARAQEALDSGSAETATVIINGKTMEFDMDPIILDGRTLVPMRAIFEELGAQVEWIDESQIILATKSYKLVSLKIGKPGISIADVSVDLNTQKELEVPPFLLPLPDGSGDRTLVPLRAVSEALDAVVLWDEATSTVTITL